MSILRGKLVTSVVTPWFTVILEDCDKMILTVASSVPSSPVKTRNKLATLPLCIVATDFSRKKGGKMVKFVFSAN